MKRTGFRTRQRVVLKRTVRLRAKRKKPGVTGRPSLDRPEWNLLKQVLWLRAKGRCERCRSLVNLQAHHVEKRSAGGADVLENLTLLCGGPGSCHDQTDWAYAAGRLVVTMPGGRPRFVVIQAPDKFTARIASASSTEPNGGAAAMKVGGAHFPRKRAEAPFVAPRSGAVYPTVPRGRR